MRLEHSSSDTIGPSSLAATSGLAIPQIRRPQTAEPFSNPPPHWPRRVDSSIRREPLGHPAPETILPTPHLAASYSVRRKPLQRLLTLQPLALPPPGPSASESSPRTPLSSAGYSIPRKPLWNPAKDLPDVPRLPRLPRGDSLPARGTALVAVSTTKESLDDRYRNHSKKGEYTTDKELPKIPVEERTEAVHTTFSASREAIVDVISPTTKFRDVSRSKTSLAQPVSAKDDEPRNGVSQITLAAISSALSAAASPLATPGIVEFSDPIASPAVSPAISAVENYTTAAERPDTPATEASAGADGDNESSIEFEPLDIGPKIELAVLQLPPIFPLLTPGELSEDQPCYNDTSFGLFGLDIFTTGEHTELGLLARTPASPPVGRHLAPSPEGPSGKPYEQVMEPQLVARGQPRNHNGKGSVDLSKPRPAKSQSQKAMLSRALQKANTAVQLDNSQNFDGARQAYAEACTLLEQVLHKTSAEEDRNKLEAIVSTATP